MDYSNINKSIYHKITKRDMNFIPILGMLNSNSPNKAADTERFLSFFGLNNQSKYNIVHAATVQKVSGSSDISHSNFIAFTHLLQQIAYINSATNHAILDNIPSSYNPNLTDKNGHTALDEAIENSNHHAIRILTNSNKLSKDTLEKAIEKISAKLDDNDRSESSYERWNNTLEELHKNLFDIETQEKNTDHIYTSLCKEKLDHYERPALHAFFNGTLRAMNNMQRQEYIEHLIDQVASSDSSLETKENLLDMLQNYNPNKSKFSFYSHPDGGWFTPSIAAKLIQNNITNSGFPSLTIGVRIQLFAQKIQNYWNKTPTPPVTLDLIIDKTKTNNLASADLSQRASNTQQNTTNHNPKPSQKDMNQSQAPDQTSTHHQI